MIPVALLGAGAALAFFSSYGPTNLTKVKSSSGSEYNVQNLPDKQDAADCMHRICGNLKKLIQHYKDDPSAMADHRISVMVERFNPDNMCENNLDATSTSYSENKGEKIVVCLREKVAPFKLIDDNTIMFVILHEMSHLMTTSIGHTPEFWANFKRILQDAIQVSIYTPVNYAKNPVEYCGMTITDSPIQ
jgi:hypothetical protein